MKMKKAKLFMMLALLIMGVSNLFAGTATRTYDVVYVGLTTEQGAGYNINTRYSEQSGWFGSITYTQGIDASASDQNTIVMKNGQANGTPNVVNLTGGSNGNYSTYFSPRTVSNYTYSVAIVAATATTKGTITITYAHRVNDVPIGDFVYSTTYNKSTSEPNIQMPAGEVAVRLNFNSRKTVTDTVSYESRPNALRNLGVGASGTMADDDGDDATGNATYTYLGQLKNDNNHYYVRTHPVNVSELRNAVVPATVTIDGEVFKVTAIQKFGFNYTHNHQRMRKICDDRITNPRTEEGIYGAQVWDESTATDDYQNINDHSNRYLESVTFAAPENITSIGDYAFMSCTKLKSFTIPKNVEYLGTGTFSSCEGLQSCLFQVDETTRRTKIKTIQNVTFWYCTALKSLELPEGIETIMGQTRGAPLQYLTSLTLIRLPNTLTTVGAHFLCCASSLKEVTIPASVTSFDGAAFHGCESLESVYLLGEARSLSAADNRYATFGENDNLCKEHVSGCTFYTTPDYLNSYASHNVWSLIDEDGKDDGSTRTNSAGKRITSNYANVLKALEPENRTFTGGKWVTAIFPNGVTDYKSVFGNKTRVARPSGTPTHSFEQGYRMYNVTFQLISSNNIPAGTPVMFCPENTVPNYPMITIENMADADFKLHMTDEHLVDPLVADDGALIDMKGQYKDHILFPMDFYFMYQDKTVDANGNTTYTNPNERAKFYRVTDESIKVNIRSTRCYWAVNVDGVKTSTQMAPAKSARFFFDNETNGIKNIETRIALEGIYDLNGRKLDVKQEDLPQGLFIINGKRVMKK